MPDPDFYTIYQLALSLTLGLVIGLEREWREQDLEGEKRPAGLRTFGLIGLSGGVSGLIGREIPMMPVFGLVLTLAVMITAYWRRSENREFMGVTTIFAAFVAFACGVLSVMNLEIAATAASVVAAMILGAKDRLHRFVRRLNQKEIFAALQFILISGVILPLIPNESMGPFDAINPFEIWLMAVVISGLSFLGYIFLRALSAKRGILGTAILGGFVSSTAVTVALARIAQRQPELKDLLSAGIVVASTIMFARVGAIAGIIHPPLLKQMAIPISAILFISVISGLHISRRSHDAEFKKPEISNPLDIASALFFAGILGVVMVGSRALESFFGAQGIYAISVASGLADVDAITLTLSRFASDGLPLKVAATGVLLAAVVNTLVKVALARFAGGQMLRPAFLALSAAIVVGGIAAAVTL